MRDCEKSNRSLDLGRKEGVELAKDARMLFAPRVWEKRTAGSVVRRSSVRIKAWSSKNLRGSAHLLNFSTFSRVRMPSQVGSEVYVCWMCWVWPWRKAVSVDFDLDLTWIFHSLQNYWH